MVSQMQTFYKNKIVFITGGSGFLGRVIIEKLLRSTEVKRIYALFRPKKGVSIKDRIAAWDNDPLFSELIKSNPKFSDRVVAVAGDCELPDLGIGEQDRRLLVNEVQIVIHSAATVRFDERLNVALDINTRGTLLMVQLAKEMSHLEAFVHVSTAFSNCMNRHINEAYYPEDLPSSFDAILALRDMLSSDLVDKMTPTLLGEFPNTYTFTKALAEQVVQREAAGLPACIFRPGMILATFKEPIPGWTDNLYGPISILYGCIVGVLRVTLCDKNSRAHVVPVDYCANMILATAWQTAKENGQRKENLTDKIILKEPIIYNYVANDKNPVTWGNLTQAGEDLRHVCPLEQMIWYPFIKTYTKLWAFELVSFFYHILPAHIIDMALRLRGQKPRMIKIYDKIQKNIKKLSQFAIINWTFEMHNTDRLVQCMSADDQKLFQCDVKGLNWKEYFTVAMYGVREYLAKEKPTEESFQKGRKKLERLHTYHRIVQTVCYGGVAALMWLVLCVTLDLFY